MSQLNLIEQFCSILCKVFILDIFFLTPKVSFLLTNIWTLSALIDTFQPSENKKTLCFFLRYFHFCTFFKKLGRLLCDFCYVSLNLSLLDSRWWMKAWLPSHDKVNILVLPFWMGGGGIKLIKLVYIFTFHFISLVNITNAQVCNPFVLLDTILSRNNTSHFLVSPYKEAWQYFRVSQKCCSLEKIPSQ